MISTFQATRNGLRMIDLMGDFSVFSQKFEIFSLDEKTKRFVRIELFFRLRNLYSYYKMTFPDLDVNVEQIIEQFKELAEFFRPMTIDTISYLNQTIIDGSKKILVEGANATMLDIDFGKKTKEKKRTVVLISI